MKGPRPQPTHLKLLRGNPGRRPINKREPIPKGDLHQAPDWFSEEQKLDWAYAIAEAPKGLLKRLDREVLAVWVVACDTHRQAQQALQMANETAEAPFLVRTGIGQFVPSPYLNIIGKQAMLMLRSAAELGFSPASRSRITIDAPSDEDENPFANNGQA